MKPCLIVDALSAIIGRLWTGWSQWRNRPMCFCTRSVFVLRHGGLIYQFNGVIKYSEAMKLSYECSRLDGIRLDAVDWVERMA
jgi:hypothetical protein